MTKAAARVEDVGPTPEFRRHHAVTVTPVEGKAGQFRCRVEDQTRLQRYARGDCPILAASQVLAGEMLLADWHEGMPVQTVVGGYEAPVDGGGRLPEGSEAAERRYREAVQCVGIRYSAPVCHVALHDGCIFSWAQSRRMPSRQAIDMLRAGLDRLVEHYGL